MNGAFQHLLVNHVSLFAIIFGTGTLVAAMVRKSADLRVLATVLFVIAGVFGWIAVDTGKDAVPVLMQLGGDFKPFIHEHAMAAVWARRSATLIAVLALIM